MQSVLKSVDGFFLKLPETNHSFGLGFSIALLPIGFFLFLNAPSSSDPHHHMTPSQTEICRQTVGNKTHGSKSEA